MALLDSVKSELGVKTSVTKKASSAPELPPVEGVKSILPNELPTTFDNPDLAPRFAKTPSRQLEEFRVRFAANQHGLDPHLAAAVAQQESGFNMNAVSPTGVRGTMQVTKKTAASHGYNRDNPDENILAGVTYLKNNIEKSGGDIVKGLSAYPDPKDWPVWSKNVLANYKQSKEGPAPVQNQLLAQIKNEVSGNAEIGSQQDNNTYQASAVPSNIGDKLLTIASGAAKGIGVPNPLSIPMNAYSAVQGLLTGQPSEVSPGYTLSEGMTDLAQQPIAQQANEVLRSLLGDPRSFKETAEAANPQVSSAVQKNPGLETASEIATGFLPGNPLTAAPGMILAPVIAKVGTGLKKSGQAIANILLGKPISHAAGETVAAGAPRLTVKGIEKASEKAVQKGEKMIGKELAKNPQLKVGLRDIAQDPDLLNMAIKYEQAGETATATKMLKKLADFETKKLDVADANELRQTLWKLSKFTSKDTPGSGIMSQFNKELGTKVREKLISLLGPKYEEALVLEARNMPVIKATKSLSQATNINPLKSLMKGTALTSTPVASSLYQTGRGVEAISPQIGQILTLLGLDNLKNK